MLTGTAAAEAAARRVEVKMAEKYMVIVGELLERLLQRVLELLEVGVWRYWLLDAVDAV